jgi:hypothetical protein
MSGQLATQREISAVLEVVFFQGEWSAGKNGFSLKYPRGHADVLCCLVPSRMLLSLENEEEEKNTQD